MEKVRVVYHREEQGWWAESPDVERWLAFADSYAELVELAEEGVSFALGRDVELEHHMASERSDQEKQNLT